jgi:hypothetical protein
MEYSTAHLLPSCAAEEIANAAAIVVSICCFIIAVLLLVISDKDSILMQKEYKGDVKKMLDFLAK